MLTRQFLRFAVVGGVGFLIDAAILMLAIDVLHVGLYAGRALSFLIASTAAWALNRNFAFRHAASESRAAEWLRYMFSNTIGGSVNVGTYAWLVLQSPIVREHPILGVACGSVAGMLVNFTLLKIFVFRARKDTVERTLDESVNGERGER